MDNALLVFARPSVSLKDNSWGTEHLSHLNPAILAEFCVIGVNGIAAIYCDFTVRAFELIGWQFRPQYPDVR
jgi:hypothetical protein